MLDAGRINLRQLCLLIFISKNYLDLTYLLVLTYPPANQDVWLIVPLHFLFNLILMVPLYFLWLRFPQKTIVECGQLIAGKAAGLALGVLYIWYFIHQAALALSQFCEFLSTAIMPETPFIFFAVSLMLVSAYAVWHGLEVISRVAELFAPMIIVSILIAVLLVSLSGNINLKALFPMLEKGFLPVVYGGFLSSCKSIELIGIAMLLPCLNRRKKAKAAIVCGLLLHSLFFLIIALTVLGTFGASEAKNTVYPFYDAIRLISVGRFIERVEIIYVMMWVLSAFIKVTLFYYLAVFGLSQLRLKDYKPFVLPVGTIIIPLSLLVAPNIVELLEFTSYKIYPWYNLLFIFLIPAVLLVVALIRKKEEDTQCGSADLSR
ncbi:MAG: spore germination protein [Firmicutes bacterium]|nr:spore germination protein [Bacillota bacterium]